jgi:hypothetical protein
MAESFPAVIDSMLFCIINRECVIGTTKLEYLLNQYDVLLAFTLRSTQMWYYFSIVDVVPAKVLL